MGRGTAMVWGLLLAAAWLGVLAPADRLVRPSAGPAARPSRLRRGVPAPNAPALPEVADWAEEPEDPSGDPQAPCPAAAEPDVPLRSADRRPAPCSLHPPPLALIYVHCSLLR